MKVKLTQEEIDTMSYDDVANLILIEYAKKMKTPDLFKKVIKAMRLPDEEFTKGIGDFFELLLTDKRFIMLENGYWDLKINHRANIIIDEDDDDDEIDYIEKDNDELDEDDTEINYDEDSVDDDEDDELDNLVIIDDSDENDEKL